MMSAAAEQLFTGLAMYWPDFVNCDKRLKSEGPFLHKILDRYKRGSILDAALGMGCESFFLMQSGFHVISNEIDKALRTLASKNAGEIGIHLDIRDYDWRSISSCYSGPPPDAIILMGNSLALLNDFYEVEAVLNEFYRLLKPGGCLMIDQRNYDYISASRSDILKGDFHYSGNYIYCGTKVRGVPIEITDDKVTFGYFHEVKGYIGQLEMIMFLGQKLGQFLTRSGFINIQQYCDFSSREKLPYDFLTYVAFKHS